MATALKWSTYADLHRKDPIKVNAGKCRGKSKSTRRKYKNINEDIRFNKKLDVWTTQAIGIVALAFLIVLIILGPENAWMLKCAYKKVTAGYGNTYECVAPKRELLRGFSLSQVTQVEAEEVKPTETPRPTKSPEPVKDEAYFKGAIREEAKKAGVSSKLAERLITIIDKCENGKWDPKATNDNKKDGKVWSTDYGITMVNDYWHAGRVEAIYGLPYKQVLTDGDLNIHYAVHYILKPQGNLTAWACEGKVPYESK